MASPTEDETVGWHHRFDGHEFEQTLGDSEGQGDLACCSPWGRRELDTTEQLNGTDRVIPGYTNTCYDVMKTQDLNPKDISHAFNMSMKH